MAQKGSKNGGTAEPAATPVDTQEAAHDHPNRPPPQTHGTVRRGLLMGAIRAPKNSASRCRSCSTRWRGAGSPKSTPARPGPGASNPQSKHGKGHAMKSTIIRILACAMLGASPIAGGAWAGELDKGIIIRGIGNNATCSADTVVPEGSRSNDRADNLSVNCTGATETIGDYLHYTAGMVHAKFCVARIKKIKQKSGSVKTDKLVGNRYHCLVNYIKAKDLANLMTEKP